MKRSADRIAVISDIHGNLPALEATLGDIRQRGIDRIYCLGDLAGKGPSGADSIDTCHSVCEATVQGNWDVMVAEGAADPVFAWHREQIGIERMDYLRGLPPTIEFYLSGRVVRLFHASQTGVFDRVHLYDTPENHAAMFDNTDFTGQGLTPDIIGYGDIHVGYVKSFTQKCLFNAGSVGNPLDVTQACYAMLEGHFDSREPAPWIVSLVRVPYDIEESIRQAEDARMPELEAYARELRTARYRGMRS
jgi:protein phosphatase